MIREGAQARLDHFNTDFILKFWRSETNLCHLLPVNVSIAVDIKEVEAPDNFLLCCSLADHRKEVHEVSKGDPSGVLGIELIAVLIFLIK